MQSSAKGCMFIKNAEGLRLVAYRCACGKLTIGYGHRILPSEENLYLVLKPLITAEEAEALFATDVQLRVNAMNASLKTSPAKLTQNQFDAMVAFIFNIGIGNWNGSTAKRDLETGFLTRIPEEMKRWIHDDHGNVVPGLVNRRSSEIVLFDTPDTK